MKYQELNFIRKYNTILLIVFTIICAIFFHNIIPHKCKVIAYTISDFIKNMLMFLMPFLLFPFITRSIMEIKAKGVYLIPLILITVLLSNFIALLIPYVLGIKIIPNLGITYSIKILTKEEIINPLFDFNFPELLSVTDILILGGITGFIFGYFPSINSTKIVNGYYQLSRKFFERFFLPILPIYIFGTMLKINDEVDFIALIPVFGKMLILIFILPIFYIGFLFYITCNRDWSKALTKIRNALPAGLLGFSTMSSLVTMPVTLKAAEKNTQNPEISRIVISTTVNCHDIGDCITIPIIALTIMVISNHTFPDFYTYLSFAIGVAIAQFSSASVPGGSIVIILPFLTQIFGFTNEMLSLIIALSICIEPWGTANNIMGNSVFVIIISKIFKCKN